MRRQTGDDFGDAGFHRRRERVVLSGDEVEDELGRPVPFGAIVDARERLEGEVGGVVAGLVVGAADGEGGGARGAILVEDDDPGARVALELQRQEGEERALPRAGRADDERVADVLDGEVQAKRRVAGGAAVDVRRSDVAHLRR